MECSIWDENIEGGMRADGIWLVKKPAASNALITEMEGELAAINRRLVNVEGVTIYSVDDDHNRLSFKAVVQLTRLSHVNNPIKALGPVNNAACSALTHAFIASHYSRPHEKVIHVWHRLVQLLQGVPTVGALRPMVDSSFAADRAYNEVESISFLNETLGASSIGRHKHSLGYPFVFGEGPIRKKHKGMVVAEKGYREIYNAQRTPRGSKGRTIEASVYKESYSGCIAAVYSNDPVRLGAHQYCLIPKNSFRHRFDGAAVEKVQLVIDNRVARPEGEGGGYFLRN